MVLAYSFHGAKIAAEGMQEQYSLRLGERRAGHGEKQHNRTQKYWEYHV
jgi:hypothetical protein